MLVSLVSDPKGESAVACEEVQLRASQCLLLLGQFLGGEFYLMLLTCQTCLITLSTFLNCRYHERSGTSESSRPIQSSMRTLQMLVFACNYDVKFGKMISDNHSLKNSIQRCEESNDGRDLRTAVSGSWAGLSVSALAHVLMQKLRGHA